MNKQPDYVKSLAHQLGISQKEARERLKRGVGSGALTGFSDAKRAEEPGSAEEEGAKRPNPKSLAVSPVKADGLATYWRKRSLAAEDLIECLQTWLEIYPKPQLLQNLKAAVDRQRSYHRRRRVSTFCVELWPIHTPESEQSENAGDGKPSQESVEADADPNHGTASGRRNSHVQPPTVG